MKYLTITTGDISQNLYWWTQEAPGFEIQRKNRMTIQKNFFHLYQKHAHTKGNLIKWQKLSDFYSPLALLSNRMYFYSKKSSIFAFRPTPWMKDVTLQVEIQIENCLDFENTLTDPPNPTIDDPYSLHSCVQGCFQCLY